LRAQESRSAQGRLAAIYVSIGIAAVAYGGSQVVMSWLVIASTGSAVVVGLLFALRMTPLLIAGGVAGTLADRMPRSDLLVLTNSATMVVFAVLATSLFASVPALPVLFLAILALGCIDAIRLTTTSTLVVDAAPATSASRAIAMSQVASRAGAALGGLVFGVVLATGGSVAAFAVAAALSGVAALTLRTVHVPSHASVARHAFIREMRDGLGLIRRHRAVALLATIAIIAEILGFSNDGLLPVFASKVLLLGAEGLGLLYMAVRIGSVVGLLILMSTGARFSGVALLAMVLIFGVSLVGFGASTAVLPSLILLGVAGSAASCIDALEQSLLQGAVDDSERGRAMGLWTICLGFGPLGFVALGILAGLVGVQLAQIIAGGAMAIAAIGLAVWPGTIGVLRGTRSVAAEVEPGIPSLIE